MLVQSLEPFEPFPLYPLSSVNLTFSFAGFLDDKSILDDINEVLGLMSAPEVRSLAQSYQLFKDKNGAKLSKKNDLIDAIINLGNNQKSVISFFTPNSKHSMKNSIIKRSVLF